MFRYCKRLRYIVEISVLSEVDKAFKDSPIDEVELFLNSDIRV